MRLDVYHHSVRELEVERKLGLILGQMQTLTEIMMATKEQLAKLSTDVAALITEAVNDITTAVAAAQAASQDPAIDALDTQVTATTQKLKDAAAQLANPPASPPAA